MATIEQLAEAALAGDALQVRVLAQDWLRDNERFDAIPRPKATDRNVLAVAASLTEMFAERAGKLPPEWTKQVLPATQPLFLLREARTMKRLRKLCEENAPAPLRRRHIYAPPNFLEFA